MYESEYPKMAQSCILITYTEFQKDERISKREIYQTFGGLRPCLSSSFMGRKVLASAANLASVNTFCSELDDSLFTHHHHVTGSSFS